jgi:hypothetical protein
MSLDEQSPDVLNWHSPFIFGVNQSSPRRTELIDPEDYVPSKRQELLTHWQGITSHKARMFHNYAAGMHMQCYSARYTESYIEMYTFE